MQWVFVGCSVPQRSMLSLRNAKRHAARSSRGELSAMTSCPGEFTIRNSILSEPSNQLSRPESMHCTRPLFVCADSRSPGSSGCYDTGLLPKVCHWRSSTLSEALCKCGSDCRSNGLEYTLDARALGMRTYHSCSTSSPWRSPLALTLDRPCGYSSALLPCESPADLHRYRYIEQRA